MNLEKRESFSEECNAFLLGRWLLYIIYRPLIKGLQWSKLCPLMKGVHNDDNDK